MTRSGLPQGSPFHQPPAVKSAQSNLTARKLGYYEASLLYIWITSWLGLVYISISMTAEPPFSFHNAYKLPCRHYLHADAVLGEAISLEQIHPRWHLDRAAWDPTGLWKLTSIEIFIRILTRCIRLTILINTALYMLHVV